MLKTNSKKAKENIQNYIVNHFDFTNYDDGRTAEPKTKAEVMRFIWNCFINEKGFDIRRYGEQQTFEDWASGLPSVLDTCYYYNRSAVEDLAEILEETESEKAKYNDETKAEKLLTYLIYKEIKSVINA